MNQEKLNALIELLDDPELSVYDMVEREFLKDGDISIISRLEKMWGNTSNEMLQERIENIIDQIQFNDTGRKIAEWADKTDCDLFEGFFLISRLQFPEINPKQIQNRIRQISDDVRPGTSGRLTLIEKVAILNHVFFNVHRFAVNSEDPKNPSNCFVNRILDTKRANPVSICILYALIAKELGIILLFVSFPRYPLLAYREPDGMKTLRSDPDCQAPLFYINPANKGAIISRKEIDFLIKSRDKQENAHQGGTIQRQKSMFDTHEANQHIYTNMNERHGERSVIKKLTKCLIEGYEAINLHEKARRLRVVAGLL